MKNINIWGYYGVNYGDDIMLQVLIDQLEKENINVNIVQQNKNIEEKIDIGNARILNLENKLSLNNLKYAKKMASNALNIWGGGTIFTDCDGDGNFRNFFYIKLVGGVFAYIGIGIGSITRLTRKIKTNYLLKQCEFSTIRDPFSLRYHSIEKQKDKFTLVSDLSYCYFDEYRKNNKKKDGNYLLITWRNLDGYYDKNDEDAFMEKMLKMALEICNDKKINKITLMAMDDDFDIISCIQLQQILLELGFNAEVIKNKNINQITEVIDNASFHISGRLHGSIASEFLNTNYISLSYSKKMDYFHQMINKKNVIKLNNSKEIDWDYKKNEVDNYYDFSKEIEESRKNIDIICNYVRGEYYE